jgi:hypothetical protein
MVLVSLAADFAAICPEYHLCNVEETCAAGAKLLRNPVCGKRIFIFSRDAEDAPMPEEFLQSVGGNIAGEAANDIGHDLADLVGKLATQELKRRHPEPVVEDPPHGVFPGAITSDELDAQVPKGTMPFQGIEE